MRKTWMWALVGLAAGAPSALASSINAVSGSVYVGSSGHKTTVTSDTKLPFTVQPDQHIETDSGGRARVVLDDGTEITIAPGSEFIVPQAGPNSPRSVPEIVYGMFRVFVHKHVSGDRDWEIRANNSVMGVRGTQFIVDATRDRTIMCTFEGKVAVRTKEDPKRSRLVQANQGVVISNEGRVSAPVTMDPKVMDYWRAETLVDGPDTTATMVRTLGKEWQWDGATAVDYLDPNVRFSQYQLLTFHAGLWARAVQAENSPIPTAAVSTPQPRRATARAIVDGLMVPNRNYLVYVQPSAAIKEGTNNPDQAGFRLSQAFAMARINSTHSLVVGRQEWSFGDGLLVGRDPWQPFTRAYDGALATLRWAPARLRLFGSMLEDRVTHPNTQDWMGGAYVDFAALPLQAYAMWVKRGGPDNNIASPNDLQTRFGVVGERVEAQLWQPFFINEEFAYERGNIGTPVFATETLGAYMGYVDVGAAFRLGSVATSIKGVYLRASGDHQPGNGRYGAFVPLLNDTHRFLGLVNAFPQLRNVQRAGGTISSRTFVFGRPLQATVDYSHFSRSETADLVYPSVAVTSQSTLGDEVDLTLGYELISSLNLMLGGGYLAWGSAFGTGQRPAYLAFAAGELRL